MVVSMNQRMDERNVDSVDKILHDFDILNSCSSQGRSKLRSCRTFNKVSAVTVLKSMCD